MTKEHYFEARESVRLNAITAEEDRQREIHRQRALRDARAQALLYSALPTEAKHCYQNAEGYRVTSNSLPLSLH
jgi:hypothetical protein